MSLAVQSQILSSMDAKYVSELYTKFLQDKNSVSKSWANFFTSIGDSEAEILREMAGASWGQNKIQAQEKNIPNDNKTPSLNRKNFDEDTIRKATLDSVNALMLIRVYRVRGHLLADLDPLGLQGKKYHPELDPASYGFGPEDMDRPIFLNGVLGLEIATMREIIIAVKATYCGKVGVEFMHIQDPEQKAWIQRRIEEERNHTEFTPEGKKAILKRLTAAEGFEKFLHVKHPGTKRFGLDGGEAMVPAIEQIMKRGGQLGIKEIVIGMAHRGRLNVLTNVMGKPFTAIFSEFQGKPAKPDDVEGSGDVKYHLGTSGNRDFDGNIVHLSLTPNPSHLEFVSPVVIGKVRAKQDQRQDSNKDKVLGLLLHGDAAVAGQGIVAETIMMTGLEGYGVGGTIHIVINNQIGFTTNPKCSRSGDYCTDIAKMAHIPIFHVNGDDAESVVHVARIATEFRQKFKKSVFIDLICYRRHGHNEGDEPAFTQPLMYKKIKTHKSVRTIYANKLVNENIISEEETESLKNDFTEQMERDFAKAENYKPSINMLEGHWSGLKRYSKSSSTTNSNSAISTEIMEKLKTALTTVPKDFNLNKKIARQLQAKRQMFETGTGFDWATAEAIAFGSLCLEGYKVRLSGQDCERGTFSQRHSVFIDQETEEKYIPLNNIKGQKAKYEVINSPLSEAGVLGFEYGYSLAEPNCLTLWEAQFGDFANGAQVIFDQFISSSEAKWLRMSGLVVLLPHGYEGQGPEHSSARPERFLQLCAEDNWQIANCTTPANYMHILRRQLHRDFRKPLIIFTPKSLLRHKACVSSADMMMGKHGFQKIISSRPNIANKDVKRIILCTGKVYYDLAEMRDTKKIKDIALIRLEQLYPFPEDMLTAELKKYPNADIVWCQEEPENMGAWSFIDRRVEKILLNIKHKITRPKYIGRAEAASPATGLLSVHIYEQEKLVHDALTIC